MLWPHRALACPAESERGRALQAEQKDPSPKTGMGLWDETMCELAHPALRLKGEWAPGCGLGNPTARYHSDLKSQQ